jgi:hypothetical protein
VVECRKQRAPLHKQLALSFPTKAPRSNAANANGELVRYLLGD